MGVPKKRLYNMQEAADYLGRTVWGVRTLIYNGQIPVIKAGRRTQLALEDMDKWIEQNRVTYEN